MTCEMRDDITHLYSTVKLLEQTVTKQQAEIQELKDMISRVTQLKRSNHSESTPNLSSDAGCSLSPLAGPGWTRSKLPERYVDGGYMEGFYVANGY